MPLLTIKDLLEGSPDEVDSLVARASGISEHYDRYVDSDKGNGHTRAPGIHASEVSGCQRRVVYSLNGEKRVERSASVWKRRFKVGHAVHEMFQTDFERMARKSGFALTFDPEVPIYPCPEQPKAAEWEIHSSCDGLFTLRETPYGPAFARTILEIKTASPGDFEKLTAPKPEHIEQAHVYMACLDVPLVWFLYFNKGNQNITPSTNPSFFIRFDPKIWADLEKRFEAAHTHVHLKTLPDRQESVGCEFCAFSWTCKPKYLERRNGFKPAPASWK